MTETSGRLAIGTIVHYERSERLAVGRLAITRPTWGRIVGYYGDRYVIETRWGKLRTREQRAAIIAVADAYPERRR